jgi:Ankyrin repeats (many copies)
MLLLLLAGPEHAISMRDKDGNTPLHCACKVEAVPAVMQFLHHKYPLATNIRNKDGYKPRDYAFKSNQSHNVFMCWLYEKWPEMETINFSTLEDDEEHALYRVLSNDPSLQHLYLDCRCPLYLEKDKKYHSMLDALHCHNYLHQLTIAIHTDWGYCSSHGCHHSAGTCTEHFHHAPCCQDDGYS